MRWLASSPYSFSKYTLSNSTSQTHTVKANWFGSWSVGRMDRWEDGQTDESCALMMCAFRSTAQPTTVSEEACPTELLARWPRQARFSDVSIGDVVLFYPALPFFMSTVRSLVQCYSLLTVLQHSQDSPEQPSQWQQSLTWVKVATFIYKKNKKNKAKPS